MGTENMNGGLWLTAMGRIVLDDHINEVFCEPRDKKIMLKSELTNGIKAEEFSRRLTNLLTGKDGGKK